MIDPMLLVGVGLIALAAHHWYGLFLQKKWRLDALTRECRWRSEDYDRHAKERELDAAVTEASDAKHDARHDDEVRRTEAWFKETNDAILKMQGDFAARINNQIAAVEALKREVVDQGVKIWTVNSLQKKRRR